jgi:hypothetical protein
MDLETREWLSGRINGGLAAGVGIGWFVAYQVAASLEPVTHQPEPWYGIVLNVGLLALIATTAVGLIMQRRWGLVVSVGAGLAFAALSVACPVSGHHPFGAWWFGQMACALGILGGSLAAVAWSTRGDRVEASPAHGAPGSELVSAGDGASRG